VSIATTTDVGLNRRDEPGGAGKTAPPYLAAGLVLAAIALSYAPNLYRLGVGWFNEPNYSHGFLVIPIAAVIFWQRKAELNVAALRPMFLGWVIVVGILLTRFWLFERNEFWAESISLMPLLVGLALAFGGWPLLRWSLPALGFLLFMFPLPPSLNVYLAGPLQTLATLGSTALLQAFGLPVLSEGNIIYIGSSKLEVAQACNGLSMLMAFVMLVTATTLIMARERPIWERVLLLLSTVPIALISNIIRIAVTAWAYQLLGEVRGEKLAHDTAGWAMMPIGLALIAIELKLMSWLIVEESVADKLIIPTSYSAPTRPAKKPKGV
jgi:exosortase